MFQSDYFLKKYGIVLDTNKSVEEQIFQMTEGFGVQDSESGDRPYIFISYAHKDSAVVLPAIKALQDKGYPVWYDAGIRPGTTWSDYIADHVRNAALVIAFMSKNAIASPHCQSEIRYAFNNGRPMLTVMLDQSRLPSGLDMQLSQWQMFSAHLYDGDTYLIKLTEDGFVASTAGAALEVYNQEKQRKAAEEEQHRKEALEAELRRREEEEAKHKEAEAAERRRRDLEEVEQMRQKKAELARKRREADEAERKRRENAEIELRCLEEEEAELERIIDEVLVRCGDPLAIEKKYQEAVAELEEERCCRKTAEQRLLELEMQHEALFSAEVEETKEKLAQMFGAALQNMCEDQHAKYGSVMNAFINDTDTLVNEHPALKLDFERYKGTLYKMAYREALVLEKAGKNREAKSIYYWLPKECFDSKARMCAVSQKNDRQACWWIFYMAIVFLVTHFLLMRNIYSSEMSFWVKALIYVVPVTSIVNIGSVCAAKKFGAFTVSISCSLFAYTCLIVCVIICIIADPYMYTGKIAMESIMTSLGYNLGSAMVSALVFHWLDGLYLV